MFTNELGRQLLAPLLQRENQIQNKTYKYIIQTNMKKVRKLNWHSLPSVHSQQQLEKHFFNFHD